MGRLAREHFVDQVVHHEAMAAGKRVDELRLLLIRAILQGERRQLQPGDPAFRARLQRRHIVAR